MDSNQQNSLKYETNSNTVLNKSKNSNKFKNTIIQTDSIDDQLELIESDNFNDKKPSSPKKLRIKVHGKLDRAIVIKVRHKSHKENKNKHVNNNSDSPQSRHHSRHRTHSSLNSSTNHHSHPNSPMSSTKRYHSHHHTNLSLNSPSTNRSHTNSNSISPSKANSNINSFDDDQCKIIPVYKNNDESDGKEADSPNHQFNIKVKKKNYQIEKNFSNPVSEMRILFNDNQNVNHKSEEEEYHE